MFEKSQIMYEKAFNWVNCKLHIFILPLVFLDTFKPIFHTCFRSWSKASLSRKLQGWEMEGMQKALTTEMQGSTVQTDKGKMKAKTYLSLGGKNRVDFLLLPLEPL